MGAWGFGSFENDDALDWVVDLEQTDDFSLLIDTFNEIIAEDIDCLEAPECSMAIAASEVVAALKTGDYSGLPENLKNWIKGKEPPSESLINKARNSITKILNDSELKELWEENTELFPKWVAILKEIQKKLT